METLIGTSFAAAAVIMGLLTLISSVIAIVQYVFMSIGLYSIMKRRGIKYPGFAWVPLLREYSMGKISDDARLKAGAQKSYLRKWILALSIAAYVIIIICSILSIISKGMIRSNDIPSASSGLVWITIVTCLIFFVMSAWCVLQYIAMFNIFRSSTESYVLFTVLSIVIGVTYAFFIFAVRKKDREFMISVDGYGKAD